MQIYHLLLRNNFSLVLKSCFPKLSELMGPRAWQKLLKDFFSEHSCQTPLYRKIPDEFLSYFSQQKKRFSSRFLFYFELAQYEWWELELSVMDSGSKPFVKSSSKNLLKENLILNPILKRLDFFYPVHRVHKDLRRLRPEPSHYLLFRDLKGEVQFWVLNPLSYRWIDLLFSTRNFLRALKKLQKEFPNEDAVSIRKGAEEVLRQLWKCGVVMEDKR